MMMMLMRKTALMRIVMIMRMMTPMIAQRVLSHDFGGVGKVVVMKMMFI